MKTLLAYFTVLLVYSVHSRIIQRKTLDVDVFESLETPCF